jgi:DNA-binding CsgD family transcriptional regulator
MTSERMRAEQALRVIGRSAQPLVGFALDGTIVSWTAAAAALLGVPACKALGHPCYALIRGCDSAGQAVCASNCVVLAQARAGEAAAPVALATHDATGNALQFLASVIVLTDEDERPVAAVHVLHTVAPDTSRLVLADLTAREREVCALLVDGIGTRAMAERLGISYATTRNHIQHIFEKLEVHSRGRAVARLREAEQHPGPAPRGRSPESPAP